ncbi:high-affinity branched-chain amino acid transport ATP-binding protein LivF [Cupriavidus necator N-1]|jgi:branched-chain amino acid transport system ATP-binding protein|uniref:High-affinity branched-chain amino acid transport ATP-binding protein LivF n=1 Tax=Cupriavidus necator (strain ATCC 43291 / DSM 13513 / CCUG 52238 / LMG 8453 / N-1) TaxID=1042878 RepID=F8GS05_CUPNN|nr:MULTISPECIES: ABC transporter ATP-binding protein [Cupriavidus]AEI80944.1 high-affinity branched-chain amino acid transport ATP-binding protein LivF [Cupriavidus necator N-1]KAI3600075.1 ABC transporter, ATP-binding protein 2 (cluster 4, leucine/isoleucine/valine/benzoate) [Cupriavidus necator H850]MDX6009430.1 ABC transporter ATP-binding protein [Cupriavidus necator]QUN31171.1 ABC transporter ATP-binding protein [Cupriavidus sp. KK10]
MLQLERVSLSYGSFRALDNITLHARAGELVVLLGANGAGKSSIFLAMSAIHRISGGSMRFDGRELSGMKPSQIVQAGLVHCPEGRKLFPAMSVEKNLVLGAYVHRRDGAGIRKTLEEVYELFPILRQKKDDAAGSLSGGQQQMVALGRALMSRPRALLLDEPSLGLAPLVVKQMFEIIQRINRAGTTVLLAEQNAYAALGIAHRAYVIESGRIVMEGDRDTLLKDEGIRKAYIGG